MTVSRALVAILVGVSGLASAWGGRFFPVPSGIATTVVALGRSRSGGST